MGQGRFEHLKGPRMRKVTLLALEEKGNVWGLGHFVGNHGGREATGKEKGRGVHLGQELQGRGAEVRGELFGDAHTAPWVEKSWDREEGPGLRLQM